MHASVSSKIAASLAFVATTAFAAPILNQAAVVDAAPGPCAVQDVHTYSEQFKQGPNECVVATGTDSPDMLYARFVSNTDFTQERNLKLVPKGNRPFVFVHGAAPGEGGCVQEWLQDGINNTPAQWDTLLDVGYSHDYMCNADNSWSLINAQNSTLLVWEAPIAQGVWATWENVVPYMAALYGVQQPAVTVDTMRNTPYSTFSSDPNYQTLKTWFAGSDGYCSVTYNNATYMQMAMADASGLMFRAALDQCFSFYDLFTGTGYTMNEATGRADTCREYLFPSSDFVLSPDSTAVSWASSTAAAFNTQEVPSVGARDARQAAAQTLTVTALSLNVGKDYVQDGEQC